MFTVSVRSINALTLSASFTKIESFAEQLTCVSRMDRYWRANGKRQPHVPITIPTLWFIAYNRISKLGGSEREQKGAREKVVIFFFWIFLGERRRIFDSVIQYFCITHRVLTASPRRKHMKKKSMENWKFVRTYVKSRTLAHATNQIHTQNRQIFSWQIHNNMCARDRKAHTNLNIILNVSLSKMWWMDFAIKSKIFRFG